MSCSVMDGSPPIDGNVYIYYASSDTRMHVATSSIDQLIDYVMNTAPDQYSSATSTETLMQIIQQNQDYIHQQKVPDREHNSKGEAKGL